MNYLIFSVENRHYAIELAKVERVIWAVATTAVEGLPKEIVGMINLQGEIIPVLSFRGCLQITDKEIDIIDQFIIFRCGEEKGALWVDSVVEIASSSPCDSKSMKEISQGKGCFSAIIQRGDRLIPVYNLDKKLLINENIATNTLEVKRCI